MLTVIENTFETIHCVISANPPALANIEWYKNDQLIRGKNSSETYSHAFYTCAHIRHIRIFFSSLLSLSQMRKQSTCQQRKFNYIEILLGENQEQLKLNFTRLENIQRLTCKTRNTIGQSEASVNVDILCKQRDMNLTSNALFSY